MRPGVNILALAFLAFWALLSHALAHAEEADIINAGIVNAETVTETPPTEVTKLKVEVGEGLLSVELKDAEFGPALEEVAKKAGFKADVMGDAYSKKISTSFKGLDIEKGIVRMLTLIREKNYTIHYGDGGSIKSVEVFGLSGQTATQPPRVMPQTTTTLPAYQQPTQQPGAFPMRKAFPPTKTERYKGVKPLFTPSKGRVVPQPPQRVTPPEQQNQQQEQQEQQEDTLPTDIKGDELDEIEEMMDEDVSIENSTGAPFIPSREKPVYIPPKTTR